MGLKEELRRLIKATPDFPIMVATSLGILFYFIPVVIIGFVNSVSTVWVETKGALSNHNGLLERYENDDKEYFYTLDYQFAADGQSLIAHLEKEFSDSATARA